jgi:hypothetical protein
MSDPAREPISLTLLGMVMPSKHVAVYLTYQRPRHNTYSSLKSSVHNAFNKS